MMSPRLSPPRPTYSLPRLARVTVVRYDLKRRAIPTGCRAQAVEGQESVEEVQLRKKKAQQRASFLFVGQGSAFFLAAAGGSLRGGMRLVPAGCCVMTQRRATTPTSSAGDEMLPVCCSASSTPPPWVVGCMRRATTHHSRHNRWLYVIADYHHQRPLQRRPRAKTCCKLATPRVARPPACACLIIS